MAWTTLCELSELSEAHGRYVVVGGVQLAVFLKDGQVHAVDNRCPHAGGSLSGGHIDHGCVVCPWHYWAFRLDNGQLVDSPRVRVRVYPTRVMEQDGGKPPVVQADLVGANAPLSPDTVGDVDDEE